MSVYFQNGIKTFLKALNHFEICVWKGVGEDLKKYSWIFSLKTLKFQTETIKQEIKVMI